MTALAPALAPHHSVGRALPGRARAYAKAQRHSSLVRVLKTAIPVGAVVASGLVIAAMVYNPFGRIGLTLGPMSFSGNKIAMEGPRLTGFKKDARPYEVTATAAFQDIRKPTVIELKDMKARLVLDESGAAAHLVSTIGVFDTQKEHLELPDPIRITTDKGEEALLKSASVDFKNGTILSKDPVKITTASGRIEAAGLQVGENGKTIAFTGGVRVMLRGSGTAETRSGAAASSAKLTQAEPAKP